MMDKNTIETQVPERPKANVTPMQSPGKTWQQTLGAALGVCIVAWFSAILLMFMVWSLLWVYGNLFG